MLKAIIFDFDGVLGDTCAMSIEVCRVFKPGLTDESFLNQYNGNVYHDNNKIRFTDEESDFFFQEMNKRFEEKHLFPFKKDLPLLGDQYSLFVVSSTRESSLEKYLKCGDLLEIFEWLMGSETHRSKVVKFKMIFEKYNLKPEECLFFTDTLGDIREANEVGLPVVGVTWGFQDHETLKKGNPRKIISEFEELLPTINDYKDK
ncbi:MAG: hypothetical protein COU28_02115 [Candidatus Magasanikbacteria bacterium CG10_big_fil_rev_8_21_14_0_10_36_16]|uniref:Carotenoid oxygenase n=1 Tax=Candidatus Magasanikbacteria bacterium CG10_big_fil_rev_8_21_14_0_10_36_16 TaxID=1974645 RepID=A0A2H0TYQ2_9BACT|nr:MAG: hypothetical protein COU28_02115 [Candidatus Magasanikbacteria bacterium CG10_big_fil_rev_8_21_14_0_10_36_16]